MEIREIRDFDAREGVRDLLMHGFTVVDDIGELLYKHAEQELLDELGHAADGIDVVTHRIDTEFGPVFAFCDNDRVSRKDVTAFVSRQRPSIK